MDKEHISIFKLLRYSFSGALVGVCLAGIFWHDNETAQALLAIIGFSVVYLTVRDLK